MQDLLDPMMARYASPGVFSRGRAPAAPCTAGADIAQVQRYRTARREPIALDVSSRRRGNSHIGTSPRPMTPWQGGSNKLPNVATVSRRQVEKNLLLSLRELRLLDCMMQLEPNRLAARPIPRD